MLLWNLYLFLYGSFNVLALPEEGGFEKQDGLLQWSSSPEDTQGTLGEYTETEYVPESSEAPRDILKGQHVGSSQELNGTITEHREKPPTSNKTWTEPLGSTSVDLLMSAEDSAITAENWGWTSPATIQYQTTGSEADTASTDGTSMDFQNTTIAPCRASNHSWTSNDTDDSPQPSNALHLSLPLSLSFFIPLYSDWNSALATWGLAWEAHIYCLGSVFMAFGIMSLVCLFALPLRCPPGVFYFMLLHFFLLSFAGIQAFILIYDAYSYLDRLPQLALVPICALPFPCLILAFSATFILLSLRSNLQISLPLAISPSFSALPKPCFLISMSVFHFGLSLSCVGVLELFPILPSIILLIPQGIFVCLTIFLSCSFFVFYCLVLVDSKHIYRLNDNKESAGSPEVIRPPRSPFAQLEDWRRALRSGLVASIFLLSCGGLQLYAILHALGFGGYDNVGFYPWPWWGFQVSCRVCEIAVCLGLALIGMHPIFCQRKASIKSMIKPKAGSWSRLSPSREVEQKESSEGVILCSHHTCESTLQNEDIAKVKSDTLPLCPIESPENRVELPQKFSQKLLPSKQSPSCQHKNANEINPSLLNRLDSTVDLCPPSPINLSRSIDQALFSESLFSHSIFEWPRLFQTSSSLSLNHDGKSSLLENGLYRASSCKDIEQEKQPPNNQQSKQSDWKGGANGSTQELCSKAKEVGKVRSHSWANRGHNFTHSTLPRAITHLSHYKRFRTLSAASQDSKASRKLGGTKQLSESKQLEWDMAVQAEFVTVCRQIDALSVCSDTIDL